MPLRSGVHEHLKRARNGGAEDGLEDEPSARLRTFASGGRKGARTPGAYFQSLHLTGRISAPEFQKGAAAGGATGSTDALVREVAKVGHRGRHLGGCHRDVVQALRQATVAQHTHTHPSLGCRQNTNALCRRATFCCLMRSLERVLSKASDMSDYFRNVQCKPTASIRGLETHLRVGGPSRGCVRCFG